MSAPGGGAPAGRRRWPHPQPSHAIRDESNLAVVGGFLRPKQQVAQGTLHASYMMCRAIAEVGGYGELHVYQEGPRHLPRDMDLVPPAAPRARLFDKPMLPRTGERYAAIYLANGEQIESAPHVLRPPGDWAPVVCSVGIDPHSGPVVQPAGGAGQRCIRPTDGFIFKSRSAQHIFREVWTDWAERFGLTGFPEDTVVIPNGVDVGTNQRSQPLREETRRRLHLGNRDLMFLSFSRLSRGTKGDQLALVVRWREVVAHCPPPRSSSLAVWWTAPS